MSKTYEATPRKLENGEWGVQIKGTDGLPPTGYVARCNVTTRAGKTWTGTYMIIADELRSDGTTVAFGRKASKIEAKRDYVLNAPMATGGDHREAVHGECSHCGDYATPGTQCPVTRRSH